MNAVRGFSLYGQPVAPSLGAWQRQLRLEAGGCDATEAIRLREQQCYGQAAFGLESLRQTFLQLLSTVSPRPRLSRAAHT